MTAAHADRRPLRSPVGAPAASGSPALRNACRIVAHLDERRTQGCEKRGPHAKRLDVRVAGQILRIRIDTARAIATHTQFGSSNTTSARFFSGVTFAQYDRLDFLAQSIRKPK
ncbi:hypothetical protein [Burkholderia sp. Bp9140]|uniref:hypothetical protein n=1 Tax=Burkholderia sp. Bp9140 TaxID=2184572 RepID=UPI000F565419|nr:hypothetical protein [Burkholderia sp. Bp9140]